MERHRRRRNVQHAGAVLVLALAGLLVAPGSPASADVTLRVSTAPDRSASQPLTGASTTGVIYVLTAPDAGVSQVSFWLDDPTRSGAPRKVEGAAPFDFAGTNGSLANGFDTGSVPNGSHTITAQVVASGVTTVTESTFTVTNGTPTPSGLHLRVSTSPDRAGSQPLSGATTSSIIYVFTAPDTGVSQVSFWLDDPTRSGPPRKVEASAPFDFAGSNGALANGFDTGTLTNGSHRITVQATVNGTATVTDALFTVSNGTPTPSGVHLRFSTSSNRGSSQPLAGASTTGVVYVFTAPDSGVTRVSFWLDDPTRSGPPRKVEGSAPFDFAGSNGALAYGFDTASLTDGSHVITAEVVAATTTYPSSTFTVSNPDPAPGGTVDMYSYSAIPNLPSGATEAQGLVIGAKLYQFGGFDHARPCCVPTDASMLYDSATNQWSLLPPFPNGGITHAGVATDGTDVFLAGGYVFNANRTAMIYGTKAVWRYNVAARTYTRLADLPIERSAGALQYLDGKLYFLGGHSLGRAADTPELYMLDLAGGATAWTSLAPMISATNHVGSAVLGGKIYAVAGQKGFDSSAVMQATLQVYDPGTNTWTQLADKPTAVSHITSTTFALDGRIVVAGGELQDFTGTTKAEVYNATTNTWSQLTPMPVGRRSGVGGPLRLHRWLYVGGGYNDGRLATPVA